MYKPVSHSEKKGGYTMIELLIGVTIAAILSSLGFSAYRKAQERQSLQIAAQTLESVLRLSQKSASIGEKNCSGVFLGEEVSISTGTSIITSKSICEGEEGSPKTTSLSGVTFGTTASILFRQGSAGLLVTNPPGTTITIPISAFNRTANIRVEAPGTISYEGIE